TRNGKVDRRALPAPSSAPPSDLFYSPPVSDTQINTALIFQEVLRKDRIGLNDNFFELGGHSLLATQVLSRIRKSFALDLPLKSIFLNPSVKTLAAEIDLLRSSDSESTLQDALILPQPRPQNFPLSFAQQRLWFIEQLDPGNNSYNLAGAFAINGLLHLHALHYAFSHII